ncbi:MAG: hypothetical protein AAGJ35_06840, partial [Myxococcota bacterium]
MERCRVMDGMDEVCTQTSSKASSSERDVLRRGGRMFFCCSRSMGLLGVLLGLAWSLCWVDDAQAYRRRRVLRPGSRPGYFTVGLGPAFGLTRLPTQLKIQQELGTHLLGRSSGPLLALVMSESFLEG